MDPLEPGATRATPPASGKRTAPNLERAELHPHPLGRYGQPPAAWSAKTLDSSRFARPRPTPSAGMRSSPPPPPSARSVPGAGRWGRNASPADFAGAAVESPGYASDDHPALDASPEMVLAAGPAAAGATFACDDGPSEFGNSFLFGAAGSISISSNSKSNSSSNSSSNIGSSSGGISTRNVAGADSSSREVRTASNRGDAGGLCSRFFGDPSRTSGEPGAACGDAAGIDGDLCDAFRGGAAAADPKASQMRSSVGGLSRASSATKAALPASGGTKPPPASPLGRAPGVVAMRTDEMAGNRHQVFHRPFRGGSAEWTGGSSTLYGEEDRAEGGGPGGAAGCFEGTEWGSGDGGDDDDDDGGDDDGDRGDGDEDRDDDGDEAQPKGAKAKELPAPPGGGQGQLRLKEKGNPRFAVAPDAGGQGFYSAGEQLHVFLDVGGGSGADGGPGDNGDDGEDGHDGFRLPDAGTDAQESMAKTAQRQQWLRRKDAAMAKFRRDCKVEVARIKNAVEDHVKEMDLMLDEELIQALDDSIAEKIEDNHREKIRARKIESLMSAFFCDPRVPKAQRVA